ncbi:hypothetical protein HHK36_020131 [Tetracentron sinense]|uniref:Uncharacterized protein n=1 Tax=Tetracentron sinense TaxID=13715 RepID=A0A834YR45_TETSI|nr:hypothetical protein HHK36_020131 [Tetracentron sinense]
MVGGSSTGDQRIRREESLPIFKRRLLGGLLDFTARELQVQTQVIAAAAAGVAAEGLSPKEAKAETENAAHLSVALVENAIVILRFVEDHLRLRSQLCRASSFVDGSASPISSPSPIAVMERLTAAAAAAEPYESVRCAFVSYGSCASDLAVGWKYRSRM